MLVGVNTNQRIEFISKNDSSEPKTIFVFQPLSGIERVELGGKGIANILDRSIVEIKNFQQSSNKLEIINSLSVEVITELMEQFAVINNITEKDAKN